MTKKTSNVQETKPIAYDALLYPVFDADYEDEEKEVIGYEWMIDEIIKYGRILERQERQLMRKQELVNRIFVLSV